ncbi:SDR family NAD(P)-dependent oxidoreductase [Rhodococcus erythropolis]|uniref:SDR family NAD(P)-dependent oxidoreductase n=1 Tax=Rhodococcus erythropolis TaxID=1833 RepID=UPI002949D04C|nr:SDR family NAD(P)-dependent oxidoreductase [Rhodococcus erythropolis]MDV6211870.1 SDR family NAD(P)-dependent oxidoreductase [Rhodococcus erythropolis]
MNRFHDQVVLVTGGAQGLGAAMATRFAAEGAIVAIGDVNIDAATALAESLQEQYGHPCAGYRVDVTDSEPGSGQRAACRNRLCGRLCRCPYRRRGRSR